MRSTLLNIISTNKYNFYESKRSKAFERLEHNQFPYEYSFHRMKFFSLNLIISLLTNLILFFAYYQNFQQTKSVDLIYTHLINQLLLQVWWGFSYKIIIKIKNQNYLDNRVLVKKIFYVWFVKSLIAGVLLFAVLIILFSNYFEIGFVTILLICTRFLFKFIYRCFHSLIFSVSRVYIPFFYIIMVDVIFVCSVLFSIENNSLGGSLLLFAVSVLNFGYYIFMAFKQINKIYLIRFSEFKKNIKREFKNIRFGFNKTYLTTAFSALALVTNSLLLFKIDKDNFMLIFTVIPLLISSQIWFKSYYFDVIDLRLILKKLPRFALKKFYIINSIYAASMISALYWLMCVLLKQQVNFNIIALIFVTAISVIFLYEEFSRLNWRLLSLVFICETYIILNTVDFDKIISALILLRLGFIFLCSFKKVSYLNLLSGYHVVLPPEIWHKCLSLDKKGKYIYRISLNINTKRTFKSKIAKSMAAYVAEHGKLSLDNNIIDIYSDIKLDENNLFKLGNGFIRDISADL